MDTNDWNLNEFKMEACSISSWIKPGIAGTCMILASLGHPTPDRHCVYIGLHSRHSRKDGTYPRQVVRSRDLRCRPSTVDSRSTYLQMATVQSGISAWKDAQQTLEAAVQEMPEDAEASLASRCEVYSSYRSDISDYI